MSGTCEEIIFRKVRLLSFGMDPFYDEKVKDELDEITSSEILTVSRRYLSYPSMSISGNKQECKYLKGIWKEKY